MGDERIQDAKGRVKEAVGEATDNEDLENKGKLDRAKASAKGAAGDLKEKAGDAVDKVREKIDERRK